MGVSLMWSSVWPGLRSLCGWSPVTVTAVISEIRGRCGHQLGQIRGDLMLRRCWDWTAGDRMERQIGSVMTPTTIDHVIDT
jgi:hypothetical protein